MHEAALAQAALPAPTFCLGLELRPYSLGHELFLIRENNPLLADSRPTRATYADLEQAVLICCQTFEECKRMHSDWLIGLKFNLWRRRTKKMNFGLEMQGFIDYRESGRLEFPISEMIRPGRTAAAAPPGAPFLLRLHQFVMRMGNNEVQAWDYPFGLAKMRWQSYWESEGAIDIYNSFDTEADAYAAAEDAKEAAAKAKEEKCQA